MTVVTRFAPSPTGRLHVGNIRTALHNALNSGPVIVCLDVGAAGWGKPGLHWVSVFGRTSKHYYLTQWQGGGGNRVSREHFLAGWQTWLTTGLSATSRGCYIPYK